MVDKVILFFSETLGQRLPGGLKTKILCLRNFDDGQYIAQIKDKERQNCSLKQATSVQSKSLEEFFQLR